MPRRFAQFVLRFLVVAAILIALGAMGFSFGTMVSCERERELELSTQPDRDILSVSPPPASADEATRLQVLLDDARAENQRKAKELQALTERLAATTAQELKSLDTFRWVAFAGFGACFLFLLMRAWGRCAVSFMGASLCAVMPKIYNSSEPYLVIICCIGGVALLFWGIGEWLRQRKIRLMADEQAENERRELRHGGRRVTPQERIAREAKAAVLDHIGTRWYDPGRIDLPKAVRA